MNVSKHMILRHQPLYRTEQIQAACSLTRLNLVPVSQRRTMSHKDVHTFRDQIPLVLTRLPPLQVECPVAELRLPAIVKMLARSNT